MKYNVGDTLVNSLIPGQTWRIVGLQSQNTQYVLQSYKDGRVNEMPFAVDVVVVDSTPAWYKSSSLFGGLPKWVPWAVGGSVLLLMVLSTKRA